MPVQVTAAVLKLWAPQTPHLYSAVLTLYRGASALDSVVVQFGIQDLRRDGHTWRLNGARLFLRGYGDDSIYPETGCPPANKTFFLERLAVPKSLGFNFVRLHSHFPPVEYFDAACELGLYLRARA